MKKQKFKDHPFYTPLLWALFLHTLLFAAATIWHISFSLDESKDKKFHLKDMSQVSRTSSLSGRSQAEDLSKFPESQAKRSSVKPAADVSVQSLLNQRSVAKQITIEESPKVPFVKKADFDAYKNRDFDTILMDTQERQLKEQVSPRQKVGARGEEAFVKNITQKSLNEDNLIQSLMKPLSNLTGYSPSNVTLDPEEGMPGFTPSKQGEGNSTFNFAFDQGAGEASGDVRKYEALDEFLDIEVYTYEDPRDQQNYYMIKIFAKKGVRAFSAMPKEILFTIDSSLSISKDRLEEVKQGIRYCLAHLNKNDVFNIIAFKEKAVFFSPSSVAATPEMVKKAESFVQNLEASEKTDVYSAFTKIVELPLARVPSNVILISDGRPTYGVVDSREVINQVSRINGRIRPVFAFSGGAKVNRYLLDFISYQNRAWSQFIKKTWDIKKGLADFYDKIKDPLFLNLRFRLNGLEEASVYPKSLPDFYNNAEFTLYGTYTNEDEFSMQLLGDVDGKTKELIFSRSLKNAKKGTEDIVRGYAFNKIYYLISELTKKGNSPELLNEINALSEKYGVTTPYSPELQKLD